MEIDDAISRRRAAVAEAWELSDGIALVSAGDPVVIPGRGDTTYPYRAHSEYVYLTDRNRPGGVLAFDPADGWVDFVAPVTEGERLWSGASAEPAVGPAVSDLPRWLAARRGRPIARLGAASPAEPGVDTALTDAKLTDELRDGLAGVRRPKDAVELERMRAAERYTAAAFAAAVPLLREGSTERSVQIELEAAAFRAGAEAMAYDTIVGTGTNSAVLHFMPTSRPLRTGELLLIDAGAQCRGYASDITRTYPVGGHLSPQQAELHSLVRSAELAAIERCVPGVEWVDVHLTAARVIAEGLVSFGLLRGDPSARIESGAVWLFFPHGIGHLVGLGVRDAGGILRERRNVPPTIPNLRIDLPLAPGFVVTVEPGVYFVPALLQNPERRRHHRGEVDWDSADEMLEFGGIRIEDNVLITEGAGEVLTRDVPVLG
jgi:Xaa-Pro aminopeptidase